MPPCCAMGYSMQRAIFTSAAKKKAVGWPTAIANSSSTTLPQEIDFVRKVISHAANLQGNSGLRTSSVRSIFYSFEFEFHIAASDPNVMSSTGHRNSRHVANQRLLSLVSRSRWLLCAVVGAIVTSGELTQAEQYPFTATNLWMVDSRSHCKSSPAQSSNGVIYLTDFKGRLFAIDPDGSQRWTFNFDFESVSTPAIADDGTVLFGSRDQRLYAVSPEGQKKWTFKTGGWVDASPAIGSDGTVYIGSWDRNFYAVTPEGKQRWVFKTGAQIVSSAAIDAAGNIYFGSHDGKLYSLRADGSKLWDFATGGPITSSPAVGREGEIYFASVDGKLYRLNPNGSLRWALRTGGMTASSPVLGMDGTIYISINQSHCAVSPQGTFRWQRPFWHPQPDYFGESAAAVLSDDTIVFTGGDGFAMTVPADDGVGKWYWNAWLAGPSYSSPLVAENGTVYVIGLAGQLYALQRHLQLAKSPWPTFRGNAQRNGRVSVAR